MKHAKKLTNWNQKIHQGDLIEAPGNWGSKIIFRVDGIEQLKSNIHLITFESITIGEKEPQYMNHHQRRSYTKKEMTTIQIIKKNATTKDWQKIKITYTVI